MGGYLIVYLYAPGLGIAPSIQRMVVEAGSMSEAFHKYRNRIMERSPKGQYSLLSVSYLYGVSKHIYSGIKDLEVN